MRHDNANTAEPPPAPESAREKQLTERLTRAYENGDVDAIIALISDDAWLTMPPAPAAERSGVKQHERGIHAALSRVGWADVLPRG